MDKAPIHLKPHSAAWFDGVMSIFELAPHHVHLLTLACDALDRGAQAREALCQRRTKTAPVAGATVHHLADFGRSKSAPFFGM